jgi:hypothetical protein
MADDPTIRWQQADTLAIQVDDDGQIWHAGHVQDIVVLDDESLVAATQTGGMWAVSASGTGIALGDFDSPDFKSLAFGPDGPRHLFAGGGSLFETDAGAPAPLLTWQKIEPLQDESGKAIGGIYKIVVIPYSRIVVLACSNGVYWSTIPPTQVRRGCLAALLGLLNPPPTRTYSWRKARGLPDETPFYGMTLGPRVGPNEGARVVVSSFGSGLSSPANIYFGTFLSGDLVFKPADVQGGLQRLGMCATSLSACADQPMRMYAASANVDEALLLLLRSDDGGQNWHALGASPQFLPDLVNPTQAGRTLRDDAGNQGNGWNNAIAAAPHDPKVVALAWRWAGCFVSENDGDTWRRTEESAHLHEDTHMVTFDARDPAGTRIYVASDGGVALLPDRGRNGAQFVSKFNQHLLNLQFQSWPARQFFGSFSASPSRPGLVAGGLQDNGNVFNELPTGAWRRFARPDDGQCTVLTHPDHVVFYFNDQPVYQDAAFDAVQHRMVGTQIPQVTRQDPTFPQAGLGQLGSLNCQCERVQRPTKRNDRNQLMYAVGGLREDVFGLFADANGSRPHWEFLFRVTDALNDPQTITALFTETGERIWVGTGAGRLFEFNNGALFDFGVEGRKNPKGDADSIVYRIVAAGDTAFASYAKAGTGYILGRDQGHFMKLTSGLPSDAGPYYGLEFVAPAEPIVLAMLFAASDDKVYISRDLGKTWQTASQGLPKRPHCCDLRFAAPSGGERILYLSTFGRSVWRALV